MSKDILVIGGGIAGIQASLDLAEMGFKVHLVEPKTIERSMGKAKRVVDKREL